HDHPGRSRHPDRVDVSLPGSDRPVRSHIRSQRGCTLAEVLVATLVLSIGLVAVATGFQYATSGVATGKGETTATFLAEQKVEQLKATALVDWTNATLSA